MSRERIGGKVIEVDVPSGRVIVETPGGLRVSVEPMVPKTRRSQEKRHASQISEAIAVLMPLVGRIVSSSEGNFEESELAKSIDKLIRSPKYMTPDRELKYQRACATLARHHISADEMVETAAGLFSSIIVGTNLGDLNPTSLIIDKEKLRAEVVPYYPGNISKKPRPY